MLGGPETNLFLLYENLDHLEFKLHGFQRSGSFDGPGPRILSNLHDGRGDGGSLTQQEVDI